MKFIVRLALAGFLLAGSTEIYGQVGVVSIGQLEKSADAIIIGSVQPVSRDRLNVSARITVSRSLKGAIAAQSQVIAGWIAQSDHSASIVSQPRSISGMWFLKAKGQNSWEFLPVLSGDISLYNIHIPVSTDPVLSGFAYEPDARTTEKIINEIGSEIERSEAKSRALIELFTLDAITQNDFDSLTKLYARWTKSSSPRLKALGLQGFIRQGDSAAISQLVNDTAVLEVVAKDQSLLGQAICQGRTQDRTYIEALGKLVELENRPLKWCAAYSLRAIHTRDTLPYLTKLLDSDSPDLRYFGVTGLASFANDMPMQTPQNVVNMGWAKTGKGPYTTEETLQNFPAKDTFVKEESKYIGFWKTWWATNQATLIQ